MDSALTLSVAHIPAMSTDASQSLKESATGAEVKPDIDGLSKDKTFYLLKNSRRRAVIALLLEHDKLSKRELGELAAARELNCKPSELPSDDRKTVMISLHQTHYDQLEKAGVIHRDGDTFSKTHITETMRRYVELEDNPHV